MNRPNRKQKNAEHLILCGRYPKDFKFTGWHPHCRCYVVQILKTEKELMEETRAILNGEEPTKDSVNRIDDVPQAFKEWIKDNEYRIKTARSIPYFLSDNKKKVDGILNSEAAEMKRSPLERVESRHIARTLEQIEAILNKARMRQKSIRAAKQYLSDFEGVDGVDTSALREAYEHGRWEDVRTEALKLAQKKRQIIESGITLSQEFDGVLDIDLQKMQEAIKAGNIGAINQHIEIINEIKKQEAALADLIPDVHTWHTKFTMKELQEVYDAVETKLVQWQDFSLEQQAKKLKFEWDDFLGGNMHNIQSKYKTWHVSQVAYKKKYEQVLDAIDWQKIDDVLKEAKTFKTKSTSYLDLISQLETAISAQDKANAQSIVADMQVKRTALKKAADARKKKKGIVGTDFGDEAYTAERKNIAVWDKAGGQLADDTLHDTAGKAWRTATELEKDKTYEYTHHYCNINEPLQGRHYIGSQSKKQFIERVDNITSYIDRNELPCDMWFTRGDDGMGVIASRIKFAGGTMPTDLQDLVGMVMQEGGFMSTGSRKGKGFGHKSVILNIYAPKGTKAAYIEPISAFGNGAGRSWDGAKKFTSFSSEHETLFQRGTKMRITKVYNADGKIYIDCEVIGQEIKDLTYIADADIGY